MDKAAAIRWYTKAALQGEPRAQTLLGLAYSTGDGAPQSFGEAFTWFTRAAEQGDVRGQILLGQLYYRGLGVPQNFEQAYIWVDVATSRFTGAGRREVMQLRDALARLLTADQLARAQGRALELVRSHNWQ
jgi:TPR repeat protein